MKKIALIPLFVASLGIGALAWAGDAPDQCGKEHHRPMHHMMSMDPVPYLDKLVKLSDEQKGQIEKIHQEYGAQMRASHPRGGDWQIMTLDPKDPNYQNKVAELAKQNAQAAEKATLLHAEMHAKVMAVLTDEQKQTLLNRQQDMRDHMKDRKRDMNKS